MVHPHRERSVRGSETANVNGRVGCLQVKGRCLLKIVAGGGGRAWYETAMSIWEMLPLVLPGSGEMSSAKAGVGTRRQSIYHRSRSRKLCAYSMRII